MTEKTPEEIYQERLKMYFSAMATLKIRDFIKETNKNSIFKVYSKEDISRFLQNPAKNEKQIRKISQFLYNNSPHYKRLINYFANMHLLRYTLKPTKIDSDKIDINEFKRDYFKMSNIIDNMNIQHEFRKIFNVCFKEDVFYGYEYFSENSYFIQQLDSDYCQISSIEDGVYNFSFDFSYFDSRQYKLNTYPKEFKLKYNKYKKNIVNMKWQELDSDKTICIKINEDFDYPLPPFIGVFEEIYDIQDYKALKKSKKEIDNYQLLAMKIPIKNEGVNEFLLDLDIAAEFFNKASQTLPDNVGLLLTPMDVEPMKFEQDKINNDTVIETEDLFWSSAGVNGNLFNSKGNSGSVVNLSTKTDEAMVFSLTRQMERWINRKIKFIESKFSYKFQFLDMTINNEKDKIDEYLKLAQYGVPVKSELAQAKNLTISDMSTMNWVENEVFNIGESWKPLSSSYTQSGDNGDKNGRPQKSDAEIDNAGEQTREIDANLNRL